MKKGYKQICTVRRAFSNPQIYPGIPAITSGINPACVMNVWGTVCLSLETLIYCPFTSSLLFVTVLLSELLAVLRPTDFIWPARLSSPPVSLSVSLFPFSRSVPVPAGLADQEPGLPWQPVLSPSRDGSSPDCVSSFTTPQKGTPKICTAAPGYRRVVTFHLWLFHHHSFL